MRCQIRDDPPRGAQPASWFLPRKFVPETGTVKCLADLGVKSSRSRYHGHRFPAEIISHAVWLFYRFGLSCQDVEDLLAKRGIVVSYESIRRWCGRFGPEYARRLRERQGRLGDTWLLDEVFVTGNGERHYLWRAVDQDGDVIDVLVQARRNRRAAERFFRKLLKNEGAIPFRLATDKLKSYGTAFRTIMPSVNHDTQQSANEPKFHTTPPGSENDRCDGSGLHDKLNSSFPCMASF